MRLSSRYVRPGLSPLSARLASCSLDVLVDPLQGILSAALSHRFEGHTYGESRPPIIFNLALSPTLRGPLRLAWCQKAPGPGCCDCPHTELSGRRLRPGQIGHLQPESGPRPWEAALGRQGAPRRHPGVCAHDLLSVGQVILVDSR